MIDDLSSNVIDVMSSLSSLSKSPEAYDNSNTGQSVNLNANGLSSVNALNFLFSPSVDKLIDNLLDVCINGKFDVVLNQLQKLVKSFDAMKIGQGLFNGQIGSHVIETIERSVKSLKFQKTASKIKKVLLVLKNLKKQANHFKDPVVREKYEQAIYAIKSLIQVIAGIYKNRKKINDKVLKGLGNIVFESEDDEIQISKITF